MSWMNSEELVKSIGVLEDQVDALELEIGKLVQKTYMAALKEHTSMSQNEIYVKWLQYNAAEDNLRI